MATATMNTALTAPGTPPAAAGNEAPTPARNSETGLTPVRSSDITRSAASTALTDPMGMVRDMMRQPTVRKVLPLAVILLVVAAFGLASLSMKAPPYRPLTMMLSEADKQVALEALKTADFKPEIDVNTGQITVPVGRFHEAKMLIASKGLPRNDQQGIEGLKDMPAMTTSQFMEQVRYNNAMEQELARSISQIAGIKSARVHLASPKQSVFVRDRVPTKASVVITRAPGRAVSAANVTAIIQLVSASVPYLAPENVSVVDNFGTLMNEMLVEQPLGLTSAQLQQKQQMEDLYRTRLVQLLAPIVGEANVSEDFDQRKEGSKTRSELYVEDRNTMRDAIGIPGSLSNTPPVPNINPAASGDNNPDPTKGQSEKGVQVTARSTKNYELDRSVRHTKTAMGNIQRLGVGVLINERPIPAGMKVEKPADGGTPTTIPYTQEELERLNQLVRGAVGFKEDRGDVVTVVSTRFETPVDPDAVPWYKDEALAGMANSAVIALLFMLFLFLVVRPMVRKLTTPDFDPAMIAAAAADAAAREASAGERLKAERIAMAVAEAAAKVVHEKAAAEAEAEAKANEQAAALAAAEEKVAELSAKVETMDEPPQEIEIQDGESLEEIKARMSSLKPKKPTISADMLNTANTYDDKVALIRMIVSDDSTRVAGVLKNMIQS